MASYPKLPCSAIVYRTMRSKHWIDRDKHVVAPAAFYRRLENGLNGLPKDKDGLSVDIASVCKVEEAGANLTRRYGVVSLHTGRIRDIGLDVVQDTPSHANITGTPYKDEDDARAEFLATLLAKQSRIQWTP